MPETQEEIVFTPLWNELRRQDVSKWKPESSSREVLELLSGALWHFELAAMMGDFSLEKLQDLHKGTRIPWQEWLNRNPLPFIEFYEHGLSINYSFIPPFDTSLKSRLKSLIQTMLLTNGALRLAGAQFILSSKLEGKRYSVILEKVKDILDDKGEFNKNPAYSKDDERILKNLLIVVALRDSFMHGEEIEEREAKKRNENRNKLIQSPNFNSAVIAQASKEVWVELVKCVKYLSK